MTHSRTSDSGGTRDTLDISLARVLSYRVPRRRSTVRPTNIIVILGAVTEDGTSIRGLGEGQPRGTRTGDDAGDSWAFAEAAVQTLYGAKVPISEADSALEYVRHTMVGLRTLAAARAPEHPHPFRGTLLGLEVALLDLIARAQGVPLADLLGRKRMASRLAPTTVTSQGGSRRVIDRLDVQRERYDHTRILLPADPEKALAFLKFVARENRSHTGSGDERPINASLNGTLSAKAARVLVWRTARAIRRGDLPAEIVLTQPVSAEHAGDLASLQRLASSLNHLPAGRKADLRIMGDASVWDAADVTEGGSGHRLQAIRVRPAQAGGLLASLDLADAVLRENPDAMVELMRMVGASRITTSALRHLALAMPRVSAARLASIVESEMEITTRTLDAAQIAREEARTLDVQKLPVDPPMEAEALSPSPAVVEDPAETESLETDAAGPEPASESDAMETEDADDLDLAWGDSGWSEAEAEEEAESANEPEYDAEDLPHQFVISEVPGLGIDLLYENLVGVVRHYATFPPPRPAVLDGRQAQIYDDVDYIRPMGAYAVHGHIVERESLAYGLNTRRFNKSTFQADDGQGPPLSFRTARWPLSSVVAASIVRHKESTRILLERNDCPVPRGRTFGNADSGSAAAYAARIGYPVVLKPAAGSMGVGVTAGIANAEELASALERMRQSVMGFGDFIVEKHIHGRDYRIMVLGEEVVAAVERVPASVLGDGVSTLVELILAKNAARKQNSHLATLKLKWNESTEHQVAKLGYSADSVIPADERVRLNSVNNLTQGGDSIEILEELHPSIVEASIKAVKAVPGLAYCGVDFLLADHRLPLDQQEAAICELNAVAALPVAEYPMFGTPRRVSTDFLRAAAHEMGLELSAERADHLTVRIRARGKVVGVGYRRWFAGRAVQFGCTGWIQHRTDRAVEAFVSGPTAAVAALATAAVLGPARAVPTSVTTVHVPDLHVQGFEIRERTTTGTLTQRSFPARARRLLRIPDKWTSAGQRMIKWYALKGD